METWDAGSRWKGWPRELFSMPVKQFQWLTFLPFEDPVCTADGSIFDLMSIIPYIKNFGKHRVTGASLKQEDLIAARIAMHRAGDRAPVNAKLVKSRYTTGAGSRSFTSTSYDPVTKK